MWHPHSSARLCPNLQLVSPGNNWTTLAKTWQKQASIAPSSWFELSGPCGVRGLCMSKLLNEISLSMKAIWKESRFLGILVTKKHWLVHASTIMIYNDLKWSIYSFPTFSPKEATGTAMAHRRFHAFGRLGFRLSRDLGGFFRFFL